MATHMNPDGRKVPQAPRPIVLIEPAAVRRPRELATWLTLLLVVIVPWPLGSAQAISQFWLYMGLAAIVALWSWSVCSADEPEICIPSVAVLVLCGMFVGMLQIAPLPADMVQYASPFSAELWEQIADSEEALFNDTKVVPRISVVPGTTQKRLGILVAGLLVFLLGFGLFQKPAFLHRLFVAVAVVGTLLALFGIIQKITWNGKLFWTIETDVRNPFASYRNHCHAANFLLMGLGSCLALMFHGNQSGKVHGNWRTFWFLCAAICLLAILMTLARSGIVAVVVAGLVCLPLCFSWKEMIRVSAVCLALGLLLGLALIAVGEEQEVLDRLKTLTNVDFDSNPRIVHWKEMLPSLPYFWKFGSGLGTYGDVSRYFRGSGQEEWWRTAENQYLETLVEMGLPGLALLLLTILLCLVTVVRALWLLRRQHSSWLLAGGTFIIVGQAVHAFFDFAIVVPANFVVFGLLTGGVLGRAIEVLRLRGQAALCQLPTVSGHSAVLITSGIILMVMYFPINVSFSAWRSVRQQQAIEDAVSGTEGEVEQLAAIATDYEDFLATMPDSYEQEWRAAAIWIEVFRREEEGQIFLETNLRTPNEVRWPISSATTSAYLKASNWWRTGQHDLLQKLRENSSANFCLGAAIEHCIKARRANPMQAWPHFRLAELCFLQTGFASPNEGLNPFRVLGKLEPRYAYAAGMLALQPGNIEEAIEYWTIALRRSYQGLEVVLRNANRRGLDARTVGTKLFSQNPLELCRIITLLDPIEDLREYRDVAVSLAAESLTRVRIGEAESDFVHGVVEMYSGHPRRATALLQRATVLRPENVEWRYQYALNLKAIGNLSEARNQLRICRKLAPANKVYRDLSRDLLMGLPSNPEE